MNEFVKIMNSKKDFEELYESLKDWSSDRGIDSKDGLFEQYAKVNEEVGELASSLLRGDSVKIVDDLGDSFITLIIMCIKLGLNPVDCINHSFDEIKDRKGKKVGNVFVKESDLREDPVNIKSVLNKDKI